MARTVLLFGAVVSMFIQPSVRADTFKWEGDNNDNWKNSANWNQNPGAGDVPNDLNDLVEFRGSANRFNVDLNGKVRTVGEMRFDDHNPYRLYNGTVRLDSNIQVNHTNIHFDTDFTLEQVAEGNWIFHQSTGSLLFDGHLTGNGGVNFFFGQVTFNSANTYSGEFKILGDGTAVLGSANALQNATVTIESDDGLNINGLNANIGALGGTGNLAIAQQILSVGSNNSNTTYSGILDGSNTINKNGAGSLTLSGVNTFSGTTNINNGQIILVEPAALQDSRVSINVNNGLGLGGVSSANIGALTGAGNFELGATILSVGVNDQSTTYSGVISNGSGQLHKNGTGTLVLLNASTFTGGVTVAEGALSLNNTSGSATGSGGVAVANGGTLNGFGSADGPSSMLSGGLLAPGPSINTLTLEDVAFEPGSTLAIELETDGLVRRSDRLAVTDTATLGGTLDLTDIGSTTPILGQAFVVLTAGTLVGTFDTVVFPNTNPWSIEYDYAAGTVTVVPCADFDNDGVCSGDDVCQGHDDNVDSDSDGVPDGCDICAGFDDSVDSDADGVPNGCDICEGFDDSLDTDSDGTPDGCDPAPVHNLTQSVNFYSLQAAIDASTNGDLIEADSGTYAEIIDFNGKAITLRSNSGAESTIIDATTVLDPGTGKPVVRFDSGESPATVIEGFTLTGGTGATEGPCDSPLYGGGGITTCQSSPTIRACRITGNTAELLGGGVFVEGGSPTLINCSISGNQVVNGPGAGCIIFSGAEVTLSNCEFVNNTASDFGGAMLVGGATVTMTGGSFIENAGHSGGAIKVLADVSLMLSDVLFESNSAVTRGGAIDAGLSPELVIDSSTFRGNTAGQKGGAIVADEAPLTIRNCAFYSNSVAGQFPEWGGAVVVQDDTLLATNCTFVGNQGSVGGAIQCVNSMGSKIVNSSFARNRSTATGAINLDGAGTLLVMNSVMWGNTKQIGSDDDGQVSGTAKVNRSVIQGGWLGSGAENIDADPLFVDADNEDLRLQPGSPAIDASDGDAYDGAGGGVLDLNGELRMQDDTGISDTGIGTVTYLDVGAFEFQGTTECGSGGDFGNDGKVDLADFARFNGCVTGPSGNLGPNCGCFDLDADGDVDTRDFAELQRSFTGAGQ